MLNFSGYCCNNAAVGNQARRNSSEAFWCDKNSFVGDPANTNSKEQIDRVARAPTRRGSPIRTMEVTMRCALVVVLVAALFDGNLAFAQISAADSPSPGAVAPLDTTSGSSVPPVGPSMPETFDAMRHHQPTNENVIKHEDELYGKETVEKQQRLENSDVDKLYDEVMRLSAPIPSAPLPDPR
jgi:hypothetical protein